MTGDTPSTPASRAAELLARMTVLEKAQQLSSVGVTSLGDPDNFAKRLQDGIGHVAMLQMAGDSPMALAAFNNNVQRFLIENTRLGIPAILHNEALSGVCAPGYTAFPTAITLAATWRPELVEEMTGIIKMQMRSIGQTQALSPVVDVARDARWGRVHETYGEDVLLNSTFGVHFVRGLQGNDLSDGVIATAKHFLGYAASQGGLNTADTSIAGRELYDVYATPFEAMIQEAGLASVMNSYATIDGVPVGANKAILTDLLRDRMGFTGTVVSDYMTTNQLVEQKKTATDPTQAGIQALDAGLDIELPDEFGYGHTLVAAVEQGLIGEEILDRSVLRILEQKFALGLFEHPYVDDNPVAVGPLAQEGQALSRELAAQAVTLLSNDGTLPLTADSRSIAVIGPHADAVLGSFANYSYPATIGMMQGLVTGDSRMVGVEAMDSVIEPGSPMAAALESLAAIDLEAVARDGYGGTSLLQELRRVAPDATITAVEGAGNVDRQPTDIPAAVAAAEAADLVILAIGGRSGVAGWNYTEGEGVDAAHIDLPRSQVELVKAVAATGTPVVAVIWMGKPYALTEIEALVPAIITGYYPGPFGASAIADALFGEANPGGKLPFTLPRATGQVPIFHSQPAGSGYARPGADGFAGYVDLPSTPLFPFGHGLSYTEFAYSELTVSSDQIDTGGEIAASVEVTNTGHRAGDEIVQVYIRDTANGVTRPERQLAAFARVSLEAGESCRVQFTIALSQLGYTGLSGEFVIEPGPIDILVGSSSTDIRATGTVHVTGDPRNLQGRRSYLPTVKVTSAARADA